ncbi:hypothetical protein [Rhodococcus oxybenzonivorans]|jgi:hypothetical protein|nr:hypothetical protein [Rhodococcus oxybenzonivorans]
MTPADAQAIEKCLSPGRVGSYHPPLVTCDQGEDPLAAALRLYRWNAEIAAALWTVMHVFEVTVRNAVSDAVTQVHGPNWTHDASFHAKLPPAPRDRSTNRPAGYGAREDLQKQSRLHPTPGKVIPELKMAFWEKMFTQRHDADFWNSYLCTVFPNVDSAEPIRDHRNALRTRYERVRRIRNRMGHHEPISDTSRFDLSQCYTGMMEVLSWRSSEIHAWVADVENVQEVLLRRPR